MKRQRLELIETLAVVVMDCLAILAAYLIAYRLRFQTDLVPFLHLPSKFVQYTTAGVVAASFLVAFAMSGLYGQRRSLSPVDEFTRVIRGVSIGMLFAVAIAYFAFYGVLELSRLMVIYAWFLSVALVSADRALLSLIEGLLRRHGIGHKRILIIGSGPPAQVVLDKILRSPQLGYAVIGLLDEDGRRGLSADVPILGGVFDVASVVQSNSVDEVIVALSHSNSQAILDIMDLLDGTDVDVRVFPDVV
ncbi:MAG: hypothetical protein JOZ39_13015, partial [Chloroflexi bacterium]|nr:hypothetical protein [Chloroflexota bacterium]